MFKIITAVLIFSFQVHGQFRFENLEKRDVQKILQDIGTLTQHTSVSGAKPISEEEHTFEFGIGGTYAQTPSINQFVADSGGDDSYNYLPTAAMLARFHAGGILGVELAMLPEIDVGEYNVRNFSGAVELLLFRYNDNYFSLNGFTGNSEVKYEQLVDSSPVDVEIKDQVSGYVFNYSRVYNEFELYLGYGVSTLDGEMSTTGSKTIFDIGVSGTSSVPVSQSSEHFKLGVNYKLGSYKLGGEYSKVFGNERFSVKATILNIF
ncbi:MAG: hypothetical protein CME64_07505 [Halobacteriovoraceae bacterium]|nr:hypothetical protein [Halobacteriovoraceae bacterium]|tara:strand:- start:48282 stop:49070 length:789 start_codon:yes stop_codon:yes gene_type:complete